MNVIGAVELPRRRADLGVAPAQVADAPAHHEVDVFAPAGAWSGWTRKPRSTSIAKRGNPVETWAWVELNYRPHAYQAI
jgi:hypothetical protein